MLCCSAMCTALVSFDRAREVARPRSVNARVHCLHLVAGDLDHRVVLRGQRHGFIERQVARLRVRDSAAHDRHQHRCRNWRPDRKHALVN